VDPRLYDGNASIDERFAGAKATGRGAYHMAKGDRGTGKLGTVHQSTGSVDSEYEVAGSGLRGLGIPVPHAPSSETEINVRDPMQSKSGFAQGDQSVNASVGGMAKRSKNQVNKAAHRMGL